ncbi:hypothetical protein L5G32_08680 [Gordonia sp. HY002]|uniref:hypothetical protein n=1 Tax=Gordonia zhenghanii TaxID=2911516 RepID=UPI001EF00B3A|nr:hypothetical protein [Gordonia zhenghanii]MCF8570337.1 hypothetical protein [Gordonia zhenghanii]MCF8607130.1 hypothetical protein [Gordonia zhenghanii]
MRTTICRGLAATIATAALTAGLIGVAPTAAAQPTVYDPVVTPCSHKFRTPIELPRKGTETYWSPFGTSRIVCFDNGTGVERFYQRDPWGNWHAMNQLMPDHWFYSVFNSNGLF